MSDQKTLDYLIKKHNSYKGKSSTLLMEDLKTSIPVEVFKLLPDNIRKGYKTKTDFMRKIPKSKLRKELERVYTHIYSKKDATENRQLLLSNIRAAIKKKTVANGPNNMRRHTCIEYKPNRHGVRLTTIDEEGRTCLGNINRQRLRKQIESNLCEERETKIINRREPWGRVYTDTINKKAKKSMNVYTRSVAQNELGKYLCPNTVNKVLQYYNIKPNPFAK